MEEYVLDEEGCNMIVVNGVNYYCMEEIWQSVFILSILIAFAILGLMSLFRLK